MELLKHGKDISKYEDLLHEYDLLGGYTYLKEYNQAIKKFGFTDVDKLKKLSEFSGGQRTKIALLKLLLSKPELLILDEPTNHLDIDAIYYLTKHTYPKEYLQTHMNECNSVNKYIQPVHTLILTQLALKFQDIVCL